QSGKKRSRVPGVMVTQFVEQLPLGKATPDFTRKPMAVTTHEGKKVFFKAMVSGEPAPKVTWSRNKGEMNDPEKYKTRYDERTQEYILEIINITLDQADGYKCFATNEYGKAVCTATLTVVDESGQPKKKPLPPKKEGEIDPKLWELLLTASKKDYERICLDFGVTDFRWLLKKLKQMKTEMEDEQSKKLDNVKQIQVKPSGRAEFSFDMKLVDNNSAINVYKDGTGLSYDDDKNSKHSLTKTGINYVFSIKDVEPADAGLYQVDVEDTNVFTTDFQVPDVEFVANLKNTKVTESEDALFQCVLSSPLNRITWLTEDHSLEDGEKYQITVSEDKLTHTLRVKNCQMTDKGMYSAIVGVTKSSASLTVGGGCACSVADRGVQFVSGLSDTIANVDEQVELSCKLSSDTSDGKWYKNGKLLTDGDGVKIIKDGACHRLIIDCCKKDDAAVYRFEAEGRKSEATLNVQDPPNLDPDALGKFNQPIIIKAGENAEWKLPFSGGAPMTIQWYKDDEELLPASNVKIGTSDTDSQLRLTKCQRKDSGQVKIKIKNEFGTKEALSRLIVLDKPTAPQGPVEVMESAVTSVEFKWKPPKDNGGCPVTNYIIERQQVGRNKWSNLGEIPANPSFKDSDVDPGRRYCYRIRAKNAEGVSDYLQTEDISAGVLRYPGSPTTPRVVSAFKDCINLSWCPPCDTGGTKIIGYNLEKNKAGTNYWSLVNQKGPITDVFEGAAYKFRVSAINLSGAGDPSIPCDTVIARDPMKPPGKVRDLKLTDSSYTSFSLAWAKPKEVKGVEDEAQGYYVEIRPIESLEWTRCNSVPITLTSYTVLGLKAMATYWVRILATNYGGDGEPQGFDKYIIAMPPPGRKHSFLLFLFVKSGNTVRLNINFEASPLPDVSWVKDGVPLAKHVTITNSDKGSQLLIPTSERSDSGIYTITVKNIVGQESFNVEIRVTDNPKPPGPLELDQKTPGTVTLSWGSSPDEKRDDRLHYMVSKRDSFKPTWRTVADNLFNNKFTVVNIMAGREYYFRVFAKNDMGLSPPSVSPVPKCICTFKVNMPQSKSVNLESPPSFLVPLKRRTAPLGYECHMSCAVKGDPTPRVTWYHENISLNTNTNYHITNVCGVCSLFILQVGPKDNGEYKVVLENKLGMAESSMTLNVRGISLRFNLF
uniref:Immunoglobulin-like and fibronectin type III domain-containing protein 1 n=1 Tax=Oryzias latipes TaxID=8090 RepID=A0A3P9KU82_ORYLA